MGKMNCLVSSPLRRQDDAPDLLHLGIVCRRYSVQVSCNLGPEVGDHHKLLEDVLGQDVGVASLLDVVRADIDVVGSQMEIGGGDGSHPPLSLAGEGVPLVVAGGRGDDLVSVLVD